MTPETRDQLAEERMKAGRFRVAVLALFVTFVFVVLAGLLQQEQSQLKTYVHQLCLQRQVNTIRSNQIWAELAAAETDLAKQAIYRNAHLNVPACD